MKITIPAFAENANIPRSDTKPKELIAALTPHAIDQAVLTGKFGVLDIVRRG